MQSSSTSTKTTTTEFDKFIDSCRSREWNNLIQFLGSSVKDLSTKVLASAVIQEHHPDATIAKKYGLAVWDSLLSAEPVTLGYSLFGSAVDLRDFTQAYVLAGKDYLNDPKVANAISNYIQINQIQLAQYLDSDQVPDSQKAIVHEVFGDLRISKLEKERYHKKQLLRQAKQQIAAIKSIAQINPHFEKILGLKASDFRVEFSQASVLQGVKTHSLSSPGSISFRAHIADETLEECAKKLQALKISANYYNMSLYRPGRQADNRGVQLFDLPQTIAHKLGLSSIVMEEDEKLIPQKNALAAAIKKSPNPFNKKSESRKTNESVLKTRVAVYYKNELDMDDLKEEISQVILQAIENNNTSVLDNFFGTLAYQDYLSAHELTALSKAIKEEKVDKALGLYQYFNTMYLLLGLYVACYKGNSKITQYFIEKQHLSGSIHVDLTRYQGYVDCPVPLKGNLLNFAVRSGNTNLVKYLYENTNTMIDMSVEQQQDKSPLMIAVECGYEKIVDYLLRRGANPNAVTFADRNSAMELVINAKNYNILQQLINAGAIVTAVEVQLAIKKGLDPKFINLLMKFSINKEDPYEPYLLTAIESGNIELFKYLDASSEVYSLDKVAEFNDMPLEKRMVMAALSSGSLEMVQFLEKNKKINFDKWLTRENAEQESYLMETKSSDDSMDRIINITTTMLYKVAQSYSRNNNIPLLQYLFEEKKLKPSEIVIKELCYVDYNNIQVTAYLLHFIENSPEKSALFRSIALDLSKFNLAELFRTYNTTLIREGNPNAQHGRHFMDQMDELITAKSNALCPAELLRMIRQNHDSMVGALFYYCNREFDKKSETLFYLLNHLTADAAANITVDEHNAAGESLVSYAGWQHSYHIVALLLAQGANPDLPDAKGRTLINRVLANSITSEYFEWVQEYAQRVTNSLRYASKTWLCDASELKALLLFTKGDTQGISVSELIENCLPERNKESKLIMLFIYLSELNAKKMVQLFRDPSFLQKNQISPADGAYYLSLFKSIDEKVLSSQDKKRRLSLSVAQQFFVPAPPGGASEMTEDAAQTHALTPPGGAPI